MKTSASLAVIALLDVMAMSPAFAATVETAAAGVTADAVATETAAAETAPPEDGAPAAAVAEGAVNNDQGLEEIVVTATKRSTNLQKTPISISVIDSVGLNNRQVKGLLDLGDGAIPSLRVVTFESRQSALTIGIRGIVPLDANQPAREMGVGVYIDGVYLGRQQGLGAGLLDIERIEVLKGPQGTLFGRNTIGGALSIISKKPSGEFGMRATMGISNYNGYNADIHFDSPMLGQFAFKVDAAIQGQGPTTKNILPGETGWNELFRYGVRGAVRWEPTDNFTADLAVDYTYDGSTPFYSQLLNYNPNGYPVGPASGSLPSGSIRPLPPIVEVNGDTIMEQADVGVPQQLSTVNQGGGSLHLSWNVSDNVELRSITAYRQMTVEQYDNAGGAHRPPVFTSNGNFSRYSLAGLWQHQFSQEIQVVGNADRLDYVAGFYYFYEKASDDAATPSTNTWNATGTDYTIRDPRPTIRGFRFLDRESSAEANSYAIYGQATWTPKILDDNLRLTVGGRVTWDDKNGRLTKLNNVASALTFDFSGTRFNPMVTLDYRINSDNMVYFKYATAYRAGGASSRSLTYASFGPEDVVSYEIGSKSTFFDDRLRANFAGYIMNRTGSQIDFNLVSPSPGGGTRNTLETVNAPGTTVIRGAEADLTWAALDNLTFTAAYAYTWTNVPDTVNPFNGRVQEVFIVYTPLNAASLAMDWSVPLADNGTSFALHFDGNYSQATQSFDLSPALNDWSLLFNTRLSIVDIPMNKGGSNLTVALWARNLFNQQYVYRRDVANSNPNPATGSVANVLGDYGNFGAPRIFGIEATVRY
jgi:iron complex outermembrane receptor protein